MKEARERLDAFEAQEVLAEPTHSENRPVALIFWLCVVVLALAIYVLTVWLQRR
jgi:hypothetical protein